MKNVFKTVLLNLVIIGIAVVATIAATWLDQVLSLPHLELSWIQGLGIIALFFGITFRLWASYIFYKNKVRVLELRSQKKLVTQGPYKISRNPLYVGIVGIALGVTLIAGSPSGIIGSVVIFIFWDTYIRFIEEKSLEKHLGTPYKRYKEKVPRWF